MSEEKAPYGYCPNCAEPFDRPYTHCPFCNAVNPHLEQDLEKKRANTNDRLQAQLEANRQWVDQNRAEVTAEVDARIEQNLADMKKSLRSGKFPSNSTTASKPASKVAAGSTGGRGLSGGIIALLILGGAVLLGVGLWLLLH